MPRLDHKLHRRLCHGHGLHVQAGKRGGTRAISRLRRAGVDLGLNQQIVVVWAVWAPSSGDPRRDLAVNYAG